MVPTRCPSISEFRLGFFFPFSLFVVLASFACYLSLFLSLLCLSFMPILGPGLRVGVGRIRFQI